MSPLLILGLGALSPVWAAIRYVPECPPSAPTCTSYESLQEAIDEATDGDTIRVVSDLTDNGPVLIGRSITLTGHDPQDQPRVGPVEVSGVVAAVTIADLAFACKAGAPFAVKSAAEATTLRGLVSESCPETMPMVVTGKSLTASSLWLHQKASADGTNSAVLVFTGVTLSLEDSTLSLLARGLALNPTGPGQKLTATLRDVAFDQLLGPALTYDADAPLDLTVDGATFTGVATDGTSAVVLRTPRAAVGTEVTLRDVVLADGGGLLDWADRDAVGTPASIDLTVSDARIVRAAAWTEAPLTARVAGLDAAITRAWLCGNVGVTAGDIDLSGASVRLSNVGTRGAETWAPVGDGEIGQSSVVMRGVRDVSVVNSGFVGELPHALTVVADDVDAIQLMGVLADSADEPVAVEPPGAVDGVEVSSSALRGSGAVGAWTNAVVFQNDNVVVPGFGFIDSEAFGTLGCDAVGMRLPLDSALRDAGDPATDDLDGSPSDVGLWGGPMAALSDEDGDGVWSDLDCDEQSPLVGWGLPEVPYDGFDQDCDGLDALDVDRDGFPAGVDCDDAEGEAFPGGPETWYDGVDGDCDGADDFDQDGDGWRSPLGNGTDCDDEDPTRSPGVAEVWYDGVDQDCDGNDIDQDGDGHLSMFDGDGQPIAEGDDCNDLVAAISPSATEVFYDGVDQDCRGDDFDQDGDGHRDLTHPQGDDCDDEDPLTFPGAVEDFGKIDRDCDGWYDPSGPVTPMDCSGCSSTPGVAAMGWAVSVAGLMRRRRTSCW